LDYKYQSKKIEEQIEEQSEKYIPKAEKSEQEMRVDILAHALNTANRMIDFNEKHEVQKSKWRTIFIALFCVLLIVSFGVTVLLLFLGKLSDLQLSVLVVNLIIEVLAIIFFMIRYVHNDLYLDTFKTVTQKLLDYLIQDKGGNQEKNDANPPKGD
jgi:hypothetical protein